MHYYKQCYIITTDYTRTIDGTTLELRIFDEQIVARALNAQEILDIKIINLYEGKVSRFSKMTSISI
jgi:hypothetical protein